MSIQTIVQNISGSSSGCADHIQDLIVPLMATQTVMLSMGPVSVKLIQLHGSETRLGYRVLARIPKLPVQNSNSEIPARPDLSTQLLQIGNSTRSISILCQKGQFTLKPCP